MQKAMIEKQMRRGGSDPWAVDFDPNLAGKELSDPNEVMKDVADGPSPSSSKSFSF